MDVENHKTLIVLVCLLGSLGLGFVNNDARTVFSHMSSAVVGGYFGATIPTNPDRSTKNIAEIEKF